MKLVWKKLTIGAIRALSGRKARKAPNTQGAPPAPLMHDIALKSKARLMGRSVMVMVLMVSVSKVVGLRSGGGRRRPPPRAEAFSAPGRHAQADEQREVDVRRGVRVGGVLVERVVRLESGRADEEGAVADVRRGEHALQVRLARADGLVVLTA